jgi:uncharacterized damage-inducible protein DinB
VSKPGLVPTAVAAILERDLQTLRREVESYPDEQSLWQLVPGVTNTAGTLTLHLTGNLQHYVGARLGGTGYIRDRPAEFARRGVSRAELMGEIEAARSAVRTSLAKLTDQQLAADYPEAIAGVRVATGEYLLHLTTHFAYHLGQLDYHRRIVTGSESGVGAMRPAELSSVRPPGTGA